MPASHLTHLGIGALTTAYVVTSAVLLSLLLRMKWSWRAKAATIVVMSGFYVVTYGAWPTVLGWPTRQDLPAQFNLVGAYVQPPDAIAGTKGSIYLWATDMSERSGQGAPRAYRLPYSLELHARVTEAGDKLRNNTPQLGRTEPEQGEPTKQPQSGRQLGQKSAKLNFYDMPAPVVPQK